MIEKLKENTYHTTQFDRDRLAYDSATKINQLIDQQEADTKRMDRIEEAVKYLTKGIEPYNPFFQKATVDKINQILNKKE